MRTDPPVDRLSMLQQGMGGGGAAARRCIHAGSGAGGGDRFCEQNDTRLWNITFPALPLYAVGKNKLESGRKSCLRGLTS